MDLNKMKFKLKDQVHCSIYRTNGIIVERRITQDPNGVYEYYTVAYSNSSGEPQQLDIEDCWLTRGHKEIID